MQQQYNYDKLKGRMRELGITQATLAKRIGISPCSLNLTLRNRRNFRQDEIQRACAALQLRAEDIEIYFFNAKTLEN